MIEMAKKEDIEGIVKIYNSILDKEEEGLLSIGWAKGVYPTEETARAALENQELYVVKENRKIVAAAIINQKQVAEYKDCNWQYECQDNEALVLHTLVVDPKRSKNGYGKEFLLFYEALAKEKGLKYLRMDTNAKNIVARAFYKKSGYREAGIVDCVFNKIPGVKLVCIEKRI